MAGFRFSELVDDFAATLERSSATVIRQQATDTVRPARLRAITGNKTTDCIVFLWTITPGGGGPDVRPANERRIQVYQRNPTLSSIPLEPGCRTLLGGWSEEFGVYAFWDPRRHVRFSIRSPSLQVTSETLETASRVGIATYLRPAATGREVVVAVAPDSLLWYVENGLPLHNAEEDAGAAVDLAQAGPDEERNFLDESQTDIQAARRYDLVQTMRAYRDSQFRPAVLRAYGYRCTVCGCALKLVDAAHIVPVSYPDSTDEVTNGLALCRLHHGAYDNGMLGVQSDYRLIVNPETESRLADLRLAIGLEDFKARLPERITPPAVIETRPAPQRLITGLRARRWPDNLVA
jgi:putative restriction endonuclease